MPWNALKIQHLLQIDYADPMRFGHAATSHQQKRERRKHRQEKQQMVCSSI